MKIEHKKIFRSPSKILKNISWPINICLQYFMGSTETLCPLSYILNVRSLNTLEDISLYHLPNFMPSDNTKGLILFAKHLFDQKK